MSSRLHCPSCVRWCSVAVICDRAFCFVPAVPARGPQHTFSIGEHDFLLDGKPIVIRTGEMHFTRVPREYWRQRLQLLRSMGMNAVCAYLFWNYHEFEPGKFNWSDQADAAEFCRIAQQEGLWVVLRPGPYVCSEWDGGGLPWWLLKNPTIKLRSQDPNFMTPATAWFKEVGRVLGPLQITHGGPILMTQVENEYGSLATMPSTSASCDRRWLMPASMCRCSIAIRPAICVRGRGAIYFTSSISVATRRPLSGACVLCNRPGR